MVPELYMKILRLFSKRVGDTKYYRYNITLPKKIVEESNLLNEELEARIEGKKIIIEKA